MQETEREGFEPTAEDLEKMGERGWNTSKDYSGAPSREAIEEMTNFSPEEVGDRADLMDEGIDMGVQIGEQRYGIDSVTELPQNVIYNQEVSSRLESLFSAWKGKEISITDVREMLVDPVIRDYLARNFFGLVDVDYLTYWNAGKFGGHATGDKIFKEIAQTILNGEAASKVKQRCDIYNLYRRTGGDELGLRFVVKRGERISRADLEAIEQDVNRINLLDLDSRLGPDDEHPDIYIPPAGVNLRVASSLESLELLEDYLEQTGERLLFDDFITKVKQTTEKIADQLSDIQKNERRLMLLRREDLDEDLYKPGTKGIDFTDEEIEAIKGIRSDNEALDSVRKRLLSKRRSRTRRLKKSKKNEELFEGLIMDSVSRRAFPDLYGE